MIGPPVLPSWEQEACDGQHETHGERIVSQRKTCIIIRSEDAHHNGEMGQ